MLVNIKYSGVCHTDLHAVNGDWPLATKLPLVGGHEGAGVVVARGELVKDVEIGDHAGIKVRDNSNQIRSFHLLTSKYSGSMVHALLAISARLETNPSAQKPLFPVTQSMEHSSNMPSAKPHMSPGFPRTCP